MTAKEIFSEILTCVCEETGREISYQKSGNGYFLFDCNDDFNNHFQLKGVKGWLFGVWIDDLDYNKKEGDELTNKYRISMFGQYKHYIDKFKPSCSPFEFEFEIDKNTEHLYTNQVCNNGNEYKYYQYEVSKFASTLKCICISSTASLIKYYWDNYDGNPLLWLINGWIFYNIKEPITKFFENEMLFLWLKLKMFFHKILFNKYIVRQNISDGNQDGWVINPRYTYTTTLKSGLSDKKYERLWRLITPLHTFGNSRYLVGIEGDKSENRGYYCNSQVLDEFDKFRDNGIKYLWDRKWYVEVWERIKYIFAYPVYWFRYKFENLWYLK